MLSDSTTMPPPACTREDLTLTVFGRRLAARRLTPVKGADGPTIVFLHEALGSIGQWKDVPERMCAATGLPVLVYDRLGYGGSDPLDGPRTPDYLRAEGEDWLPAVLDAAGIDTPPVLFGHSDGGSIALYFAAAHPTAALVTEAAHIFIEDITLQGIRDFGLHLWDKVHHKLERYHGAKTEAVYRAWHDTWLQPEFAAFNMEDRLPHITCPGLIVQGTDDEYGSPAQVHGIVRGIARGSGPGAEAWFLPGCGHVPHLERKQEVVARTAAAIRRML